MYTIDEYVDDLCFERSASAACPEAVTSDVIFFDIETTGLSASTSGLYLIGCMFTEGSRTVLRQFFADDLADEENALNAFADLLSAKNHIVHFNGSTFDIPYLKTKYMQHGLTDPFDGKTGHDLYRNLMPLKRLYSLGSMKQKALEELCGIYREDRYTGGELISVYKIYQREILLCRAIGKDETETVREMRKTLLLHNNEDIKGMLPVAELMGVLSFVSGDFEVLEPYDEGGCVRVGVVPRATFPEHLIGRRGPFKMLKRERDGSLVVKVPLVKDSLKLFMNDFRDHYYIPSKDMAIHASVAGFLDKKDRKKATPATCYVHCEGCFFTVFEEDIPEGLPLIKREYTEKTAFVREEDLCPQVLKAAVLYRLKSCIRSASQESSDS